MGATRECLLLPKYISTVEHMADEVAYDFGITILHNSSSSPSPLNLPQFEMHPHPPFSIKTIQWFALQIMLKFFIPIISTSYLTIRHIPTPHPLKHLSNIHQIWLKHLQLIKFISNNPLKHLLMNMGDYGGFHKWWISKMDRLFHGKPCKIDDN